MTRLSNRLPLVVAATAILVGGIWLADHRSSTPTRTFEAAAAAGLSIPAAQRVSAPDGAVLGAIAYTSLSGKRCVRFGPVEQLSIQHDGPGAVEDGVRTDGEVGNCSMHPDPVAFQVVNVGSNPVAHTDGFIVVAGLARDDVESVDVRIGQDSRTAGIGADGAFIAVLPRTGTFDDISVSVRSGGATVKDMTLALPPDPEAIYRGAEAHRPK